MKHRDGAQRPDIVLIVFARRADDRCAAGNSQLNGDGPHRPARPVDDYGFSSSHSQQVQAAFGGLASDGQRGRVGERQPGRYASNLAGQGIFGVRPSRGVGPTDHRLAYRNIAHVFSDRVDDASNVDTWDCRQSGRDDGLHSTGSDRGVHLVDPARLHSDPHLPRSWLRKRNVCEVQDLGAAERIEHHCPHGADPFIVGCVCHEIVCGRAPGDEDQSWPR